MRVGDVVGLVQVGWIACDVNHGLADEVDRRQLQQAVQGGEGSHLQAPLQDLGQEFVELVVATITGAADQGRAVDRRRDLAFLHRRPDHAVTHILALFVTVQEIVGMAGRLGLQDGLLAIVGSRHDHAESRDVVKRNGARCVRAGQAKQREGRVDIAGLQALVGGQEIHQGCTVDDRVDSAGQCPECLGLQSQPGRSQIAQDHGHAAF